MAQQKPPRFKAEDLPIEVVRSEVCDETLQQIVAIVLGAVDHFILMETAITMSDEEVKLLEREVERTKMKDIARRIKTEMDSKIGPTFHVAYGRSFGLHVTHETGSFVHMKVDDADIVIWKHGE